MPLFDPQSLLPLSGAILPVCFATIEDDEDRDFITALYLRSRALIYKTVVSFFKDDSQAIEDAFGDCIIRMCKYCHAIRFIQEEQQIVYLMCIVRSVCNTHMKDKHLHRKPQEVSYETLPEDMVDESADHDLVFNRFHAIELLNSFHQLSEREKTLIRLRHIDGLNYNEIAAIMNSTPGAMRIALLRAKRHLEELALKRKEESHE